MKSLAFAGLLFASSLAYGQACFSPGCPEDGVYVGPGLPVAPLPEYLCFGADGCFPIQHREYEGFVFADSTLPNGYRVLGWAGPCEGPISNCPDILNQATNDLRLNALRINRGLRHSAD